MSYKNEGLFDVRLSWAGIRLLNVGFFIDDQQNLVIANSQRHKLDELYRREATGDEKTKGDSIIRTIKAETGLSIEAFGALVAIFFLTKNINTAMPSWSKKILFPAFEQRPEIKKLRLDAKEPINQKPRIQDYFTAEIEKKRLQIDFQTLLGQIGVDSFAENGRFITLTLSVLERSYEQNFTDDQAFPNRYKYRRILSALLN